MTSSTVRSDLTVLDTNVLVYALDSESEQHPQAKTILERAFDHEAGLCVTPQTLAEFFAVVTSPRRVRSPMTGSEALTTIEQLLALPGLSLLPVPVDVVARWTELARRHPVTGSGIFDLQLVATMLGNGIRRIYTFDRSDFGPIQGIDVLIP